MKRVFAILLFILAIIVGLAVPELWLNGQDSILDAVQTIDLSEPKLHWNDDKGTHVDSKNSAEEIAEKLELFATDPALLLPQSISPATDTSWVYTHAKSFLDLLFELETEVTGYIIEYRYAWFESGTTVPIWSIEMVLNGMWHCFIDIDEASGIIMRCSIHSAGAPWEELFPNSFTDGNRNTSDSALQELISFRFCEALNTLYAMSTGESTDISAFPIPDQCSIAISITDQQQTIAPIFSLYIHPEESIMFNYALNIPEEPEEVVEYS